MSIARRLFMERGYLGMNMDQIAEASEYSKGTVYGHFASKEDLVAAICTDNIRTRGDYFQRATSFSGRPRERLMAVGISDQIFVRKHPDHFATEHVLNIGSVYDRISEQRQNAFFSAKSAAISPIQAVIEEAVSRGDLIMPEGQDSCQTMYGLWTQSVGHHAVVAQPKVPPFEQADLDTYLWYNYQRLLDGYLFRPLSHELDYNESRRRILDEVFPEEQHVLSGVWAGEWPGTTSGEHQSGENRPAANQSREAGHEEHHRS